MTNASDFQPEEAGADMYASARLHILNDDLGIRQRRPRGLSSDALRRAVAALEEIIVDLSVPEEALADFVAVQPGRSLFGQFALDAEIGATLAETGREKHLILLRNITDFSRWRRQAQFRKRYQAGEALPILIADGDSWFQFPIFLRDVLRQLSVDFLVWPLANAGDTLMNMVYGKEATGGRRYARALAERGHEARAFLFSGGGNDLIGLEPDGTPALVSYLRRHKPGRSAAWHIDTPEFARRIGLIERALRQVARDVAAARPGLPMLVHGYDYALPCPQGLLDRRHPRWAARDQFFGAAMRNLGIQDVALQTDIVRAVVDALNGLQRRLAGGNVAGGIFTHVFHIDARHAVGRNGWADEIHPGNVGYANVADRFRAVLALPDVCGRWV